MKFLLHLFIQMNLNKLKNKKNYLKIKKMSMKIK